MSIITKENFVEIARAIRTETDSLRASNYTDHDAEMQLLGINKLVNRLEKYFRLNNPNFDTGKFSKACGFEFGWGLYAEKGKTG